MKLTRFACFAFLSLACGPANVDNDAPEAVGTERAELVAPGGSGVLLFARDGEAALLNLRGNVFVGMTIYRPGGTWRPIATADFNGDGHGDILWRDANNQGRLSLWTMFGGRNTGYSENPTSPGWFSGWGTPLPANFNGDQINDILFKGADGPTTVHVTERWTMQANSAMPTAVTTSRDPNWMVAGVGKLYDTGGEKSDIFWSSTDGYSTRFDLHDGNGLYDGPTVHPDWQVKGIADFNADGTDDILWRHRVTGEVSVWPLAFGWPQSYPSVTTITGYSLLGAGDIDGDKVAELIWRGSINADIAVTLLNSNFTVKSYGPSIPLATDWKFVGVLRAPGKFGYAKFAFNKTRVKPDQCPTRTFTVTPTNGPGFTRQIQPPGYPETCSYVLEMVDLQDSYKVDYQGGCEKVNIMAFQLTNITVSTPLDRCKPPAMPPMTQPPAPNPMPNPPPTASNGALMAIWGGGPAPFEGPIWYASQFPPSPVITGNAVSITNPNPFVVAFPTAGNTTNDCADSSKSVWLNPGAAMSSGQMAAIYGNSRPRLPIWLVGCAAIAAPPIPSQVLVTVTHAAQ